MKTRQRRLQVSPPQPQVVGLRRCANCGHVGPDVHTRLCWVGGVGFVERDYCDNARKCWDRWDKVHRLV